MIKQPGSVKRYTNKSTLVVYLILRALVILTGIRCIFTQDYESVALCILTLILLILPSVIEKRLKIEFPNTFEVIILLFIYSAEILGEIDNFYVTIPHWDTMLHTFNGFACAAIGFALVDMLNRSERISLRLSPLYLALAAFCFSMTVGVCWEFFEHTADQVLRVDMQKDTVLSSISSVTLDPTNSNKAVIVKDISDVIVVHSDGTQESLGLGGYLDIGLYDTMKDLFVNLIGAVVFSIIGYIYVKQKDKGTIASRFIPIVQMDTEEQ